jgi:hypothetical protein
MKNRIILLLLLLSSNTIVNAQGKPYFQQEVHYKIDCALNDKSHTLSATMELEYINRSNDTLTYLYFHLWPNAYKDRTSALAKQQLQHKNTKMFFAKPEERGSIDSLNFKSDGRVLRYQIDKNNIDICKIDLSKPLYPGQRVIISTPFFVKIPNAEFSRLGHIGQAYAITQWYPKPAVYDNKGWHAIPYLDQGEFYSEYGSYDVSITLPSNYVVGATGDLVDGEKELAWMNTKAQATSSMNFPERTKDFKPDMSFPPSTSETKTLKFHQENVHDFGWFADKRFNVLKGEAIMPRTGKHVTTWSLFTNKEADLWKRGPEYIKDALEYYSKWIGDYPYNQCTAVDGTIAAGGGMEYPNVTIIGTSGDALTLEVTIAHEVGHNWFYGLFGTNEREHPWMDEGINSFYEMRYWLTKYPPAAGKNENDLGAALGWIGKLTGLDKLDYKQTYDFEYNIPASAHFDQPIEGNGPDYIDLNYGAIVYRKTGFAFQYLRSYLGDNIFDKAMQDYFVKWCYKHPYPEDMHRSFEESTGKDLDWFFVDLIQSNKKLNYGIRSIKKTTNGYALTIKDRGNLRTPFSIAGIKNGEIVSQHWIDASQKITKDSIQCKDCDHIVIDPDYNMPDVNRINNSVKTKGLFKKIEPISLNFLAKVQYPAKNRLFLAPSIGWNNYNGFMGGMVIHNIFLPVRNFEFVITPMYGFKDGEIAGMGNLNYKFYTSKGPFTSITLGVNGQRFAYADFEYSTNDNQDKETDQFHYLKFEPYLTFNIRQKKATSSIYQNIKISSININQENKFRYNSPTEKLNIGSDDFQYNRITYSIKDQRAIDPWKGSLKFENNKSYNKIALDLEYKISYEMPKKGVSFRIFGGYLLDKKALYEGYGFNMSDRSAGFGTSDYAYDNLYFGRTENYRSSDLLSRQIYTDQGGFKIYTPIANNQQWIASLNITADFPIPLPLRFFADIGTTEGLDARLKDLYNENTSFIYEAGVSFYLAKDVVEVYFPFIKSKPLEEYYKTNNLKFGDMIRFKFDIAKMNPLKLRNMLTER